MPVLLCDIFSSFRWNILGEFWDASPITTATTPLNSAFFLLFLFTSSTFMFIRIHMGINKIIAISLDYEFPLPGLPSMAGGISTNALPVGRPSPRPGRIRRCGNADTSMRFFGLRFLVSGIFRNRFILRRMITPCPDPDRRKRHEMVLVGNLSCTHIDCNNWGCIFTVAILVGNFLRFHQVA